MTVACDFLNKGKDQLDQHRLCQSTAPVKQSGGLVCRQMMLFIFHPSFFKYVAVKHFSVFLGEKRSSTLDEFEVWKKGGTLNRRNKFENTV